MTRIDARRLPGRRRERIDHGERTQFRDRRRHLNDTCVHTREVELGLAVADLDARRWWPIDRMLSRRRAQLLRRAVAVGKRQADQFVLDEIVGAA